MTSVGSRPSMQSAALLQQQLSMILSDHDYSSSKGGAANLGQGGEETGSLLGGIITADDMLQQIRANRKERSQDGGDVVMP